MRALILTAALALPAYAQTPQCMGLPDALAGLAQRYQERPRVSGLTSAGEGFALTEAPKPGVMN